MPHKHTRRERDLSQFDLPPSQVAKPLPVDRSRRHRDGSNSQTPGTSKKRKARGNHDDAPRAFKRLMALAQGKKVRSGLDDGTVKPTQTKRAKNASDIVPMKETPGSAAEVPTIRPGEKMSDFAARVDASLPLSGLVTKTVKEGKDPLGFKVRRTKKERQMHKLYDEWREEDKKIKEKRQEEMDEEAERRLDEDLATGTWREWTKDYSQDVQRPSEGKGKKKNKKRGKKRKEAEDDPWKEFEKRHSEPRRGLYDTADAPPDLRTGPGNKFKVQGDAV